jgi:hypothetical protein
MWDNKKIEKLERGKPWEEERKRGGEERREKRNFIPSKSVSIGVQKILK